MNIETFALTLLTLNLIFLLIFIRKKRVAFHNMEAMVIVMAICTTFGLSIGFVIGYIFDHSLLNATLIACGTSSLVGIIIGGKFNDLSQLEGFFTGLMSAMMATMLIVMLPVHSGIFLIFISLLLLTGITMLFIARTYEYNFLLLLLTCLLLLAIYILFPHISNNVDFEHESSQKMINRAF